MGGAESWAVLIDAGYDEIGAAQGVFGLPGVERAVDRRDWLEDQCNRVIAWLENNGFDPEAPWIAAEELSSAIAGNFHSAAVQGKEKVSTDEPYRQLTKKTANEITEKFIAKMRSDGRTPTASGLVAYSGENRFRGNRELLRTTFRELMGDNFIGAGRPQKRSPK